MNDEKVINLESCPILRNFTRKASNGHFLDTMPFQIKRVHVTAQSFNTSIFWSKFYDNWPFTD